MNLGFDYAAVQEVISIFTATSTKIYDLILEMQSDVKSLSNSWTGGSGQSTQEKFEQMIRVANAMPERIDELKRYLDVVNQSYVDRERNISNL